MPKTSETAAKTADKKATKKAAKTAETEAKATPKRKGRPRSGPATMHPYEKYKKPRPANHNWVSNPQKNFGQEYVQPGDNTKYLKHAMTVQSWPEIDISDDKEVEKRLNQYFNLCVQDDMKPTVTGMCCSLGINKDTIWQWRTGRTRKDTHSALINKYYDLLESLWEDYMLNGKVNPACGIFLGRNHWGYRDQVEVVVQPKDPYGDVPDQKALDAKLADVVVEAEDVQVVEDKIEDK